LGHTITEKILASRAGRDTVRPGDLVVVRVDTVVPLDVSFMTDQWPDVVKIADPERVVVMYDHIVPAKDIQSATAQRLGREFVARFGITRFHDVGPEQGICHQIIADYAYAVPGEVLVCVDSHTCSGGAFNCAARGVGPAELIYALCKGETWFKVGKTVRYELSGTPRPWVSAKDIFLYQAGRYGSHEGQNLEYGGPAMAGLTLDARRTISTMSAELSAEFAIWEPDQKLIDHVRARVRQPFTPVYPDPDADYADVRRIDLGDVEPHIGLPDTLVHNTTPISELRETVKLDQCFIGSCANGTLDDLASAATVVKGKKVAPHVRFIVTPGSQRIYREALKLGYVETLMEAGALVTTSTCGACSGIHIGLLGPGETCLTASTRNFKGRMGSPEAKIYMGSPATVAAAAIAGEIVDPRKVVSS
jgi:3-isopropylmalate/(R)-2-methylmalate dehydratase large subunit